MESFGSVENSMFFAGVIQWLECHFSKVDVTGSSPVTRSNLFKFERGSPAISVAANLVSCLHQMYFVYILQSLKDLRTYTGYSDNVERRLKQHNSGQVLSTKNRIPFKIFLLKNLPPAVKLKKENYIGKVVQEEEN